MEASGWRGAAWARVAAVVLTLLSLSLGGQAQAAETTTYVLTDVQGTVLAREDAQGNIIARYDYRPYGKQQTGPVAAGPGYTGHVEDPDTGLVYMQQRYYDPEVPRFISPDPIGPAPGNIYNFNRYAYAANNPITNIDPDGQKCATVDGKASCAFDVFKDKKGNAISREEALSSGSKLAKFFHVDRGSHILRAEAAMTAKYSAAKNLAAKGGSVTIKGNEKLGIPDQKISGSTIVNHMEAIQTIANPSPNSAMANMIAGSPIDRAHLGAPSNGPIRFYKDGSGASNLGQTFGHEILHTIYTGAGLSNGGWANPDFNYEHQEPFNDASDAIQ